MIRSPCYARQRKFLLTILSVKFISQAQKTDHYFIPARHFVKRFFDIIASLAVLIFLSPIIAILCILTYLKIGSPILFTQIRPGLNEKPFLMYKFRTMKNTKDSNGTLLPDDQRLTPFGRWLRSTSLDELPELLNVLRGDMSLVGPRPLLMRYLPLYSKYQTRRHEVPPGITGWAQVNGRNAISWEEKFKYDVWYVDNRCFLLDIKILLMTVQKVVKREGISAQGEATMPEFTGNNTDGK